MSKLAVNAAKCYPRYPVGTPGQPWGQEEREQWLQLQKKQRDFFQDIVSPVMAIPDVDIEQYGEVDYRKFGFQKYPLLCVKSRDWDAAKPLFVITGGTHGYETSGFVGAVNFARNHVKRFSEKANVLVHVGQCPWGYSTVNRWTISCTGEKVDGVDPNRCWNVRWLSEKEADREGLNPALQCQEAMQAMRNIQAHAARSRAILLHVDLHETTDTDNTEFTPAKIARDGSTDTEWHEIPDGLYLVGGEHNHCEEFDNHLIDAVSKVTHIAEPDERGLIIGEKVSSRGCILIAARKWQVCGAHTDAKYSTTTEIYPQPGRCEPAVCDAAQEAIAVAACEFVIKKENL